MHTPSRRTIFAAEKGMRPIGIGMGVIGAAWELVDKLGEHIFLSWIAEHLGEHVKTMEILTWSVYHPWLFAGFIGVVYLALVAIKAMVTPEQLEEKLAAQATMPHQETHGSQSPVTNVGGNLSVGRDFIVSSQVNEPARPQPQFEFVGLGQKRLILSKSRRDGLREAVSEEDILDSFHGVTLRFRNVGLAEAMDVVAQLTFVSEQDHFTPVDYGVWLDTGCDCQTIQVGDTREVFLMTVADRCRWTLEDLRRDINREYDPYIKYLQVDFTHVEVCLFDQITHGRGKWRVDVFDLDGGRLGYEFTPLPLSQRR